MDAGAGSSSLGIYEYLSGLMVSHRYIILPESLECPTCTDGWVNLVCVCVFNLLALTRERDDTVDQVGTMDYQASISGESSALQSLPTSSVFPPPGITFQIPFAAFCSRHLSFCICLRGRLQTHMGEGLMWFWVPWEGQSAKRRCHQPACRGWRHYTTGYCGFVCDLS